MRKRLFALLALALLAAMMLPSAALAQNVPHASANPPQSSSPGSVVKAPAAPLPKAAASATSASAAQARIRMLSLGGFKSAAGAAFGIEPNAKALEGDIAISNYGVYYWSGDYLFVDGWVDNNSGSTINLPQVRITVSTLGGTQVIDDSDNANAWAVVPDDIATFQCAWYLPSLAGDDLDVFVDSWGVEEFLPTPIQLTFEDSSMSVDGDGLRIYTCTYRNDSAVTVESPVIGGYELDADGNLIDALEGYEDVVLAPGQSFTIDVVGYNPYIDPDSAFTYCEALEYTADEYTPVYRFYNKKNGSHFYTASAAEKDYVISTLYKIYSLDGVAYNVSSSFDTPLHRFYNKKNGSHFYTASEAEKASVMANLSKIYSYDGVAYWVSDVPTSGSTPVYRFYNKKNGSHFYTASEAEKNSVLAGLWRIYSLDGAAFNVVP